MPGLNPIESTDAAAEVLSADQAQRHFRLLSGTIYHLKNTMAVVSEYLELLSLRGELTSEQREYVERGTRSIGTALRLLGELHEIGRADAGEIVPQREPLNVGALVRDIMRDSQLLSGTSGVVFELDLPALPSISTDPDCVRQILDNLVSNAVRYSPANGSVIIRGAVRAGRRATDPHTFLCIDVVDQGPGVIELDDVFEEIERVGRKGAPGFRLAISRRIARLLGGDLTLHSAAGAGSTFSLWLPLPHG